MKVKDIRKKAVARRRKEVLVTGEGAKAVPVGDEIDRLKERLMEVLGGVGYKGGIVRGLEKKFEFGRFTLGVYRIGGVDDIEGEYNRLRYLVDSVLGLIEENLTTSFDSYRDRLREIIEQVIGEGDEGDLYEVSLMMGLTLTVRPYESDKVDVSFSRVFKRSEVVDGIIEMVGVLSEEVYKHYNEVFNKG